VVIAMFAGACGRSESGAIEQRPLDISDAQLKQLVGSSPGTLGPLFDGVAFGAPATGPQADAARARVKQFSEQHGLPIEMQVSSDRWDAIVIDASSICVPMARTMANAWGKGQMLYKFRSILFWRDPKTGARAILDADKRACGRLVIDRSLSATEWIGHGDAAVISLDAIGKPASQLAARLGAIAKVERDSITWRGSGIYDGGSTDLVALVDRGRVVEIKAKGDFEYPYQKLVIARLTELFGDPIRPPYPNADLELEWRGSFVIKLQTTGIFYELMIIAP
jgi:hypothetical protein